MRKACSIVLTSEERSTLEQWASGQDTPRQLVLRAQIILLAAAGMMNDGIASQLGIGRNTVSRWRSRFAEERLAGLENRRPSGSSQPTRVHALSSLIIDATLETLPSDGARWTGRDLARKLGVSPSLVYRVWKAHGLLPHASRAGALTDKSGFDLEQVRQVLDSIEAKRERVFAVAGGGTASSARERDEAPHAQWPPADAPSERGTASGTETRSPAKPPPARIGRRFGGEVRSAPPPLI
jgi:transposase-like protein